MAGRANINSLCLCAEEIFCESCCVNTLAVRLTFRLYCHCIGRVYCLFLDMRTVMRTNRLSRDTGVIVRPSVRRLPVIVAGCSDVHFLRLCGKCTVREGSSVCPLPLRLTSRFFRHFIGRIDRLRNNMSRVVGAGHRRGNCRVVIRPLVLRRSVRVTSRLERYRLRLCRERTVPESSRVSSNTGCLASGLRRHGILGLGRLFNNVRRIIRTDLLRGHS